MIKHVSNHAPAVFTVLSASRETRLNTEHVLTAGAPQWLIGVSNCPSSEAVTTKDDFLHHTCNGCALALPFSLALRTKAFRANLDALVHAPHLVEYGSVLLRQPPWPSVRAKVNAFAL